MTPEPDSRFRPFIVVRKVRESSTICSFHLAPKRPEDWRPFEAGQFLTIQVPVAAGGSVVRNYTVSSAPAEVGLYRITVKKELAPSDGIEDGLSSCWLHDIVEEGAILHIDRPRGAFKLDRSSVRPVILLSGGVGITPTVSMLKVLAADSDRPVWFIHACDSGEVHALADEVEALCFQRPGISVHYCYRFPTAEDIEKTRHHSVGFVSRQTLQSLLPLDDYEVYMCGPPPFMQAMYSLLTGLGIEKSRIAYEFFGPASLLVPANASPRQPAASDNSRGPGEGRVSVTLQKTGDLYAWDNKAESLLTFLEDQGLEPSFSCRAGICGSCLQTLVSGDVEYVEEPLNDPPPGRVLLCCAKPASSIILDL
ncbi:oxidoreductase [Rhizobium leguminosarum bv. trifolii]|uniref:nitric oxide dioxygenase n=1 Tax=Rhizobium leguminosarum bv. trifolii TaxID=386 RepID=A0A3E1B1B7_RHILT|nr:2Fe-2S iron-sulfur cluster-binding protein [Rhizobium leguminosarum]RFB83474.1 oxidoreductase [Rhizobium leguminosarum bv. trifolii]RFB84037.1 oxidoreductase [Rhizobium leguminosarum bv. trifolii]